MFFALGLSVFCCFYVGGTFPKREDPRNDSLARTLAGLGGQILKLGLRIKRFLPTAPAQFQFSRAAKHSAV